jgi:hypothetical protein
MKSFLPPAVVGLGVFLLLASFVWGFLFPPSRGWTEEKSLRLRELSGKAHILVGEVYEAKSKPNTRGGRDAADLEREFKQVTAELEELGNEAEGKINATKTAAQILRWSGAAFIVAGALVVFAKRR